MKRYEILPNGVRKYHDWGYSEVYAAPENCFSPEESDEVIAKLSALPSDALKTEEKTLLQKLKDKRKTV